MVQYIMQKPASLDHYRHAIKHAVNGRDLELLIYRALPSLYADMKMPYVGHSHASVATKLTRREHDWELWFNIEAPKAIAALTHLDPTIFKNLSGGEHQASAIVKGTYSEGFSRAAVPFVVEPVFEKETCLEADKLNKATSIQAWWDTFYEVLPWSLARARGWTEPNAKQWEAAQQQVAQLRAQYGDVLKANYILRGRVVDAHVHVKTEWASSAADFSSRIQRTFYSLLSHNPWMELDSSGVYSFNMSKFNVDTLSSALCERAKSIVRAHCGLMGTHQMPAYLLKEAMERDDHCKNIELFLDPETTSRLF